MTHEQAAAFAAKFDAARRLGFDSDAATARCGYRELALETAESRNRGDVITAEPDEPDEPDDTGMVAALLARVKGGPAIAGTRGPRPAEGPERRRALVRVIRAR